MENIRRVTGHLATKNGDSRSTLTLVPSLDGNVWIRDEEGCCWRVYLFIEHAKSFDVLETEEQASMADYNFSED